jgi:hypothetical protein
MAAPKNKVPVKSEELPLTIKIPGGTATFCKKSELSPRKERELDVLFSQISPRKIKAIQHAHAVIIEGEKTGQDVSDQLTGDDTVLTEEEARLMFRAAEVGSWAYLKSWSLKVTEIQGESSISNPRPLPENPDAFLDLPSPIYKAITDHVAKIIAQDIDEGFSVASAGNPDSPTGA